MLRATLNLSYYETVNFGNGTWIDRWVEARQVKKNWNELQATKDKRVTSPDTSWLTTYGALDGTDVASTYESQVLFWQNEALPKWKLWDLTALTQKWLNSAAPNYGVMLRAANEDTAGYAMRLYSSEASPAFYQPYLEVIYSTDAAIKTVYFLKDHLGSIRAAVLDSTGAALVGFDDYDPWGYPLALRTKAIPNAYLQGASKSKFTGKERDDDYGLNLDYFGARYYDSQIGRFPVVDRFAEKYPSLSPYQYGANNPVNVIDINGDSTFVVANNKGAYTVTGGNLSGEEDDTGIYTRDAKGNLVLVGQSITTHSFFNDDGEAVVGAVIDPASYEGTLFIVAEIIGADPSLIGYMSNATENQKYDFKNRGVKETEAKGVSRSEHHYRGSAVPFTGSVATFGSARDFGNIGAGIVAGRAGLSWEDARLGFDALESIQRGKISKEGTPTQKAQKVGHSIGVRLRKID